MSTNGRRSIYEIIYNCLIRLLKNQGGAETMKSLPKIALGAWAWGNDGTFGNNFTAESLKPIFDTAMENGLNLWDTASDAGRFSKS